MSKKGGTGTVGVNNYICTCTPGYKDTNCEIDSLLSHMPVYINSIMTKSNII